MSKKQKAALAAACRLGMQHPALFGDLEEGERFQIIDDRIPDRLWHYIYTKKIGIAIFKLHTKTYNAVCRKAWLANRYLDLINDILVKRMVK